MSFSATMAAHLRGQPLKTTRIVNLGRTRDLLAELDRVRKVILSGEEPDWYFASRDKQQKETVSLAGVFLKDPNQIMKSALRAYAIRTDGDAEDVGDPPAFQASRL
jgi:hypothetical protein